MLEAEVAIVSKEPFEGKLERGTDFSIFSGDDEIGTGVLLELFNDALAK